MIEPIRECVDAWEERVCLLLKGDKITGPLQEHMNDLEGRTQSFCRGYADASLREVSVSIQRDLDRLDQRVTQFLHQVFTPDMSDFDQNPPEGGADGDRPEDLELGRCLLRCFSFC